MYIDRYIYMEKVDVDEMCVCVVDKRLKWPPVGVQQNFDAY